MYESTTLHLRCLLFLVQMDRRTTSIECVVILIILVVWSVDPKFLLYRSNQFGPDLYRMIEY